MIKDQELSYVNSHLTYFSGKMLLNPDNDCIPLVVATPVDLVASVRGVESYSPIEKLLTLVYNNMKKRFDMRTYNNNLLLRAFRNITHKEFAKVRCCLAGIGPAG